MGPGQPQSSPTATTGGKSPNPGVAGYIRKGKSWGERTTGGRQKTGGQEKKVKRMGGGESGGGRGRGGEEWQPCHGLTGRRACHSFQGGPRCEGTLPPGRPACARTGRGQAHAQYQTS